MTQYVKICGFFFNSIFCHEVDDILTNGLKGISIEDFLNYKCYFITFDHRGLLLSATKLQSQVIFPKKFLLIPPPPSKVPATRPPNKFKSVHSATGTVTIVNAAGDDAVIPNNVSLLGL